MNEKMNDDVNQIENHTSLQLSKQKIRSFYFIDFFGKLKKSEKKKDHKWKDIEKYIWRKSVSR